MNVLVCLVLISVLSLVLRLDMQALPGSGKGYAATFSLVQIIFLGDFSGYWWRIIFFGDFSGEMVENYILRDFSGNLVGNQIL